MHVFFPVSSPGENHEMTPMIPNQTTQNHDQVQNVDENATESRGENLTGEISELLIESRAATVNVKQTRPPHHRHAPLPPPRSIPQNPGKTAVLAVLPLVVALESETASKNRDNCATNTCHETVSAVSKNAASKDKSDIEKKSLVSDQTKQEKSEKENQITEADPLISETIDNAGEN